MASSILRIVEEEAARHGLTAPAASKGGQITRIELHVGVIAGIEARTLSGCFTLLAEGTVAQNATLLVQTVPMRGQCDQCGKNVVTHSCSFDCPLCGSTAVQWTGGNELTIAAIKVQECGDDELRESGEGTTRV